MVYNSGQQQARAPARKGQRGSGGRAARRDDPPHRPAAQGSIGKFYATLQKLAAMGNPGPMLSKNFLGVPPAMLILRSTGIALRCQLQPLNQEVNQVIPTGKDPRTPSGLDSMAKRLTPDAPVAEQGLLIIAPFPYRMAQQGQESETAPHRRAVLLALPTVGLAMGALGLEPVVLFVGALPARPTRLRHV